MKSLVPYLIFPVTCREALAFYADILGGEITLLESFRDAPFEVDKKHQDRVFNAEMTADTLKLKASDDMPGHETTAGNNVCLFLSFADDDERRVAFDQLSNGGQVLFPLDKTFGMLEDRFGFRWMLALDH